ncbi:MAG: fluoride efflux transporter CrcB [Opitutaceae bacterium]
MPTFSHFVWIALGSALGGVARYALSLFLADRWGEAFPWGTLVVNLTGSFVIGFVATLVLPEARFLGTTTGRLFVMTGILGGYTTYSSFSLQTFALMREGAWLKAAANAGGTFVLCFVAVAVGHALAAWLNAAKGV